VNPLAKLKEMGLELPPAPKPVGSYVPCVRAGSLLFVSGQLPMINGRLRFAGKVPTDQTPQHAADAARTAVLNALAIIADAAGGLANVKRIVRLGVFVNSAEGFMDQPKVANGASDLLAELFGDAGRHARAAVGVRELPLDATVELELIAELAS
jgi:enamine deaminase RidA (YjgF/YER057c/UK114 family)